MMSIAMSSLLVHFLHLNSQPTPWIPLLIPAHCLEEYPHTSDTVRSIPEDGQDVRKMSSKSIQ